MMIYHHHALLLAELCIIMWYYSDATQTVNDIIDGGGGTHGLSSTINGFTTTTNNDKNTIYKQCDKGHRMVEGVDGFECLLDMCHSGDILSEMEIASGKGILLGVLGNEDGFGESVVGVGDLDGDGVGDIAVGARYDGRFDRGAVYTFLMNPDGSVKSNQKISYTKGGLHYGDGFGASVAGVGDLNGDGVPDLAVGAPGDYGSRPNIASNLGAVYIMFLNTLGSVKSDHKITGSTRKGGWVGGDGGGFGASVAGVGDLNRDGVVDLLVVDGRDAQLYMVFLNSDGSVKKELKVGPTQGLLLNNANAFIGAASVAAVGDLNGDGLVDLAVGAPTHDDGGGRDRGAVYIFFMNSVEDGSVKGVGQKISSTHGGLVGPLDNGDAFGSSVAGVGDLNRDGVEDLAVGAPFDDDGGYNRGAVYILLLNTDGSVKGEQKISSTQGGVVGPLAHADQFGTSVAVVGDLDKDGVMILVVGAPHPVKGGSVYVIEVPPGFVPVCVTAGEVCVSPGSRSDVGSICDVDECATDNGGCDQQCHNEVGSHSCSCNPGWDLNPDGRTCSDMNECTTTNDAHRHKCNTDAECVNKNMESDNVPYTCECGNNNGYVPAADNSVGPLVCTEVPTYCNDHPNCGTVSCSPPRDSGAFECGCTSSTHQLARVEEVNVCLSVVCADDVCFHSLAPRSMDWETSGDTCSGFKPDPELVEGIDASWILAAPKTEDERHAASQFVTGEEVQWIGLSRDPDNHWNWLWLDGTSQSTNAPDQWHSGQPDDSDNKENCGIITPLIGRWSPGGRWADRDCRSQYPPVCSRKRDFDECATDNGGCDQQCHNEVAGHSCSCNSGWDLNSDGRTCSDVDECVTDNGSCDQQCHNEVGSHSCSCNSGWDLNSDGRTCSDMNECTTTNNAHRHKCNTDSECVNKNMESDNVPYTCECGNNNGYVPAPDNSVGPLVCTEVPTYCNDEANCGTVSCSPPRDSGDFECGCTSPTHQLARVEEVNVCLSVVCADDLCFHSLAPRSMDWETSRDTCSGFKPDPELVENVDASWMLAAPKTEDERHAASQFVTGAEMQWIGLSRDPTDHSQWIWLDGTPQSTNAPDQWHSGQPDDSDNSENCGTVVSLDGQGGRWADQHCSSLYPPVCSRRKPDVDECATDNGGCGQQCHNEIGSHSCSCNSGWDLNSDGRTCSDMNECTTTNDAHRHKCNTDAECVNKNMESDNVPYTCECGNNNGYVPAPDNSVGPLVCTEVPTYCNDHPNCGTVSCSPPRDSGDFECGCTSSTHQLARVEEVNVCLSVVCADDVCFHSLAPRSMDWETSRDTCSALKPDPELVESIDASWMLAMTKTDEERHAASQFVTGEELQWIGLSRDPDNHSNWLWLDGTSQSTHAPDQWHSGQPDDSDNKENCVVITPLDGRWSPGGRWADRDCRSQYTPVCSRNPGISV